MQLSKAEIGRSSSTLQAIMSRLKACISPAPRPEPSGCMQSAG
jgi:hypothetical protein